MTSPADPLLGRGGGGPHSRLGTMLACTPCRPISTQLLTAVPDRTVGEPGTLRRAVVHDVETIPCSLGG